MGANALGVGVIGYGYWGPNLVRNFSEAPGSRVVAVCDQRAERLSLAAARCPGAKMVTRPADVFADPAVEAVVIATPISTHFDLALAALKAGKHVLVEKPMTSSVEQGERLLEAAAKARRVVMVGHTFVHSGAVRKIKEFVDGGRLGKLFYYDSVRVNLGLFQHDVNVLWDLAVHDLAVLDYLLGGREPREVTATGAAHLTPGIEDVAYLTCLFDDGLIAHIHVNWLAPVKIRRTLIGGDRQMIVYDDLEPDEKIKVYDRGVDRGPTYSQLMNYRSGDAWIPNLDRTEALRPEAVSFVESVRSGQPAIADGRAGLRVVRILEAAERDLRRKAPRSALNGAPGRTSAKTGASRKKVHA